MGLEEYQKKRDFRRTPEPSGEVRPASGGKSLEFVVQKHHASHLHYDFRLELDGTLKSWAVPKGPSLVPSTRRLAMHVEDHPLEYGSFEGVIPEGEYGGGTVLLWDHGTWLPEGDPAQLYRKGRLKFTLEGEKLRGRWNLVRTRGAEDAKESWLLIKDRDEESRSKDEPDITETRPESVVTGRTLEEVAADRDRVWHSNREDGRKSTRRSSVARRLAEATKTAKQAARVDPSQIPGARKGPLPSEVNAQLATLVTGVPDSDDWIHEIKFDGYRLLVTVKAGVARLVTRNGKDWTSRFSGVADAARALPCEQVLLDGEAVVLNEEGVSSFQALQNALGRNSGADVFFYAFDLLHLDGWDLTRAPLLARKEALAQLVGAAETGGVIRYSDHVVGHGRAFHAQACRIGLEGILSKRGDRPHHGGRTSDWLKIKCLQRQEFVVVGFTEPSGSREGFGALLLGVRDDAGQLVFAGKVGTGFSDRTLRELHAKLRPLERKTAAVVNPPTGAEARSVHWVEPKLVAEVSFAEWTDDGRIRHPAFQGLREDKAPSEVVREQPKRMAETRASAPAKKATPRGKESGTRVAGIAISNADRVLYKEAGVTKGDVARYWEAVWPAAQPYLLDRPLTLVRCPAGPDEQCFYQKHWGKGMPEAVPRISIEESDGPELYMYIDDLPALVSLVQFGVLEFHLWNAKRDRIDRPDQMMFDLDPDEDLPWGDVVSAAVTMHEVLEGLGLRSFVKTTGGKGLHVVVPLQRRSTWDEVRQFTQGVAESFAKAEPGRFTAVMSKRRRTGRIYIDYLRNAYNSTAIAAYSTRTKPGATVSVPITWDELTASAERPAFTLQTVPARVQSLKQDPWDGFDDARQTITARLLKAVK